MELERVVGAVALEFAEPHPDENLGKEDYQACENTTLM